MVAGVAKVVVAAGIVEVVAVVMNLQQHLVPSNELKEILLVFVAGQNPLVPGFKKSRPNQTVSRPTSLNTQVGH